MSQLAAKHGAINLSQGFPDFDGPELLRDRVSWHMNNGHNQYAPLAGVPELQKQIAAKVFDCYGRRVIPETEVVVTPGATEAIYCALSCCVQPDDEVILFDPSYDTYAPGVALNGGVARRIPLRQPDFAVDWLLVGEVVNDRTRAIVINTPHNPTGSVWTAEDLVQLEKLVRGTDIVLISDEVYEHITFDGLPHQSLLRNADLADRAFCISSFGKTYHVTGWRIGYCVAPQSLMREFLLVHQFTNFSTNAPLQYALADFMEAKPRHHEGLASFYQHRRDFFASGLGHSRFKLLPSRGTYFQLADYSEISDVGDREFAQWLTQEHGVAAIPVSVFYESPAENSLVRFCFAKEFETLEQAVEILSKI